MKSFGQVHLLSGAPPASGGELFHLAKVLCAACLRQRALLFASERLPGDEGKLQVRPTQVRKTPHRVKAAPAAANVTRHTQYSLGKFLGVQRDAAIAIATGVAPAPAVV